jgi:transposase
MLRGSGDQGISEQSIYLWRRQDGIDKGMVAGLTSGEKAALAAARRRISELETEPAVHRRAAELLGDVVHPKGGSRRSR